MEASQPQTTDDLLRAILAEQEAHRAEVAELRQQMAASRPAPAPAPVANRSPEETLAARMAEIGEHSHYCPGCGLLYDYPQRCTGKSESGHPPIEVVSTDELKSGDPLQHTAPAYAIR